MRTTIDIPDPLFRRVKKAAAEQGVTLRDLMLRALGAQLEAAPPTTYVFDWKVFPGDWNPDLPIDNNAALLDLLDPVDRYMAPPPAEDE
jgi:hypothetical protein